MAEDQLYESVILRAFREALKLETFPPDGNFFNLGGDSLSAAVVTANLEPYFETITMLDIYRNPSPRDLLNYLKDGTSGNLRRTRQMGSLQRKRNMQ